MSEIVTQNSKFPVANKGLITLLVMLATIMQMLDTTIANVALGHMQGSLSATQDQITWVLTSYIVATAIMTLSTGWLVGRFGRKTVFMTSVAGFTLASALCGLATSLGEMVFYRILQGAFGASLVPISQAVLLDINPKEKHPSAMAMWGMGIMLGPILGPTIGGYLTEFYDWRWVFYINLPVGIICLFGISACLTESKTQARRFDVFGFITLSIFIGMVQMMLDRGQQEDWFDSMEIILYCGVAIGMLWMFVWHSHFTESPFLSPEMLRDRNFVTGLLFIFFVGIVLIATMVLLPPYMQAIMGYPVMDVGVLLAPRGIGTMLSMLLVGKLNGRIDARLLIFIGLNLVALSLWQMTQFSNFVPANLIIISGFIQGLGLGLIFVPLTAIGFATLDEKYRTEGAGLFSLMRNIGSSIGVSVVIALLGKSIQTNHSYLGESITSFNTGFATSLDPQSASVATEALVMVNNEINRQAATIGYINDFSLMMWIVIISMPMVLLLRNPSYQSSEH